jgi:hypothetical protein
MIFREPCVPGPGLGGINRVYNALRSRRWSRLPYKVDTHSSGSLDIPDTLTSV